MPPHYASENRLTVLECWMRIPPREWGIERTQKEQPQLRIRPQAESLWDLRASVLPWPINPQIEDVPESLHQPHQEQKQVETKESQKDEEKQETSAGAET